MSQPNPTQKDAETRQKVIDRWHEQQNDSQRSKDELPTDEEVYDDLPGRLYRTTTSNGGVHIPEVVENDDDEWVKGEEGCPHIRGTPYLRQQPLDTYYGPDELEFCSYCVKQAYGGED